MAKVPSSIESFENWQNDVLDMFCSMELQTKHSLQQPFTGDVFEASLGRINLARIESTPIDVYRHKTHIGEVSDANYLVKFQLQGQGLVQQLGRKAYLDPGDFVICSTADPYELHFENTYRQAVLAIPHTVMNNIYQHTDDFLGVKMSAKSPTINILSNFVANLVGHIEALDPAIAQRMEANVLDMLATCFYANSTTNKSSNKISTDDHLRQIKRLVSVNLRNPNLSLDFIAEIEGISKRYIHMLFKKEDITISKYILQQRLEACRRVLINKNLSHLSSTDIAYEWGFSDSSHFHHCFKSQFNITPRQCRLQALES